MYIKRDSDKKQRIIDAAMKLISEKGYHGATTASIAKEAGVSQGIIFHYFKNKEKLFLALLKEGTNKLLKEIDENISGEGDIAKKIQLVVQAYCKMARREVNLFKVLTKQLRGSGLSSKKLIELGMSKPFNRIKEIIEEGINKGTLRKFDVDAASICLLGIMDYTVLKWILEGKSFSLDKAGKTVADVFLRGVIKKT